MNLIRTKTKSIKVRVHVESYAFTNEGTPLGEVKVYGNLSPEEAMKEALDYVIKESGGSFKNISIGYRGGYDEVIELSIGDFIEITEGKYGKVLNGESKSDVSIRPEEGAEESGESS